MLTIEALLSGKERVEAPPQVNPFAKAQREGKAEKQTDFPGAGGGIGSSGEDTISSQKL